MFTQNNNNFNQQNPNAPKEKTNFPIGKIYGSNGIIETKCWKSQNNALYISLSIKQQIGKDPQGRTTYENGLAKEIPSILLRADSARALYMYLTNNSPENYKLNDFSAPNFPDSKISFIGNDAGVRVTITDQKGMRTMDMPSVPVADKNYHPLIENFLTQFKKAMDCAILYKVADELANNSEEAPF